MLRKTGFCFFIWFITSVAFATDDWQSLAPGIAYQDLGAKLLNPWAHIHVFRINLNQNQLELVLAKDLEQKTASVDEFSDHKKALIAINGGFFDHKYRPLGLRISNHQQQNALKRISWWGVFYTQNKKPYLASVRQFRKNRHIDFALQSGPRLIIDGRIPSLKPGVAERSALGITSKHEVIILATENSPMSTQTLAELMHASPLNCHQAINLDGGHSTQMAANIKKFHINVNGFSNVSDAIVVVPR